MPLGKTIRLYLADGSPTGPIIAEIINWTGQVIVGPRAQLHEMAKRDSKMGLATLCIGGGLGFAMCVER